jgi:hypothetical protein
MRPALARYGESKVWRLRPIDSEAWRYHGHQKSPWCASHVPPDSVAQGFRVFRHCNDLDGQLLCVLSGRQPAQIPSVGSTIQPSMGPAAPPFPPTPSLPAPTGIGWPDRPPSASPITWGRHSATRRETHPISPLPDNDSVRNYQSHTRKGATSRTVGIRVLFLHHSYLEARMPVPAGPQGDLTS